MEKPFFNKVAIVGVGLIGGSMGLAMKKRMLAGKIVGVTRTKVSADIAKKMGAVDEIAGLTEAITNADLVILAAPVLTIIEHIKQISENVKLVQGPVIDVGSSKTKIWDAAKALKEKGIRFIGCHPMAGSEQRGPEHAKENLFEGAICFLTMQDQLTAAEEKIANLWTALGAKVQRVDASTHDAYVSAVSHLTHLLAFTLMQSLDSKRVNVYSSEGLNPSFRSLVRLAKSDPDVWADIFVSNTIEVKDKIKRLRESLDKFERNLDSRTNMLALLQLSKTIADGLLPDKQ